MKERERLQRLYQQTLLSLEKNQIEKMSMQQKLSDPKIKAADVHKLATALKHLAQTIDYEIKTLKNLAVVIEPEEDE